MAQEDYTQIKIHKTLIEAIDDLRTARMSRTHFINAFMANYLIAKYSRLKSEAPIDPGEIDLDIWSDLYRKRVDREERKRVMALHGHA